MLLTLFVSMKLKREVFMAYYLLLVAVVILLCLFLNKMTNRLGIPMLLLYILLGMLFGTDGILKIPFDNYEMAETICTVSLIFIMFYGGFGTNWKQAKKVALQASLLSTVGVVLTAVLTGVFCHFVLRFAWMESLLIGAVISSTDAASVFAILRSKRLNLKDNTASLLEVESGSNDPCAYMMTVLLLSMMSGTDDGIGMLGMVVLQIIFGVAAGVLAALAAGFVLNRIRLDQEGLDMILVFSMVLMGYAGAEVIGGNGYLSVYIAGILLGNRSLQNKKALVHFFDGITGLMQILIFFMLGLLAYPSSLPAILPYGIAVAVFLTLVARPAAVFAVLAPFRCSLRQMLLVSAAGLRGAASIVFAILAVVSPAYMKHDIFHIVIFIVLFSIALQGTLLPRLAKKLDMLDENADVMRTFSDYSDEFPVEFVKVSVRKGHPWANRRIRQIETLPDLLLVLIIRGDKRLVPRGNTMVREGDKIVLSALSPEEHLGVCLTELEVDKNCVWIGKPLSQVRMEEDKLVLLLKREDKVLIPNGDTVIQERDIMVIGHV